MKRNRNSDDLSDAKEDAEFSRTDDKIDRGIVFCVASHQLWIVLTCGQCSTFVSMTALIMPAASMKFLHLCCFA